MKIGYGLAVLGFVGAVLTGCQEGPKTYEDCFDAYQKLPNPHALDGQLIGCMNRVWELKCGPWARENANGNPGIEEMYLDSCRGEGRRDARKAREAFFGI